MPLPTLLTAIMLILSLAFSRAWSKPPSTPRKDDIAHTNSTQQQKDETISGFLPNASEMEANLASTLFSGLWTHSIHESCFPPNPQPGADSRSGKQLTQPEKRKGHSQSKLRGRNKLTNNGRPEVSFTEHGPESESDDTPGPSDFLQSAPFGFGKMRAFHPAQVPCQQSPDKQMEILKGNLAGQLTAPLPQYMCRFCPRTYRTRGRHTRHENNCKSKLRTTIHNEPSATPSILPSSSDSADRNKELLPDEEAPLTLAECSRLVSAFIEHPEWQDFLDSGRHATTQTTGGNSGCGWNGLKLDTVTPPDKETPFPALTTAALKTLMQLSPAIGTLHSQLQTGKDPLADMDDLKAFIKKASQSSNELFSGGNHSLVIKWRNGPGYVLKIARSERDHIRLNREKQLYLWLRDPGNFLLNLTTTPMRAAFGVSGKPVLALRQVDGTARNRLLLMRAHHSLKERLDFALSVISHFCRMYRRFLEKDVLLADRHEDNIGFNEIPLQGRRNTGLDDTIIQVPVMLDLDPYWFGEQESREVQLRLPTWVPVVVGLLEEVFTPADSNSQISKNRIKVIDQIRKFATPVFPSSSLLLPDTKENNIEPALQSCLNHWFQNINPYCSTLLAEAQSHIKPLLTGLNQWDSALHTVAEWNIRLQQEVRHVLQWLNNWKNETEFSLLNDFTDEGIIRASSLQGTTLPWDQQILTLLSMIHGKLGCQRCSRTFTTSTELRRHGQLHQQKKLHHCRVCGGNYILITRHERIHTGEKPYECEHCGRCFAESSILLHHLRIHSGDKPYRCEHCGKCFSQGSNLQAHRRIHTGEKPYRCEHCGKCFAQRGTLTGHLRIHFNDKPYKCKHCGRCFSRNSNLQAHLRAISGERPYKCEHCGRCFSRSANLRTHLRTHSGEKPYKCERCGKCFSQSGHMKIHLRTQHGYQS